MIGGPQQKLFRLLVVFVNRPAVGAAQLDRMGNDSRQHGFEVERRAYGLTDFAEGFELAHRARQFVGSLIQFFEQAHVLDRDNRLVGKGLQEFDLFFSERPDLGAANVNSTNRDPFPQQWRSKKVRMPRGLAKAQLSGKFGLSLRTSTSRMWIVSRVDDGPYPEGIRD